jgi:hypothetical protein
LIKVLNNRYPHSQSYFTTGCLPPISSSWRQASWDSGPVIFFLQLNTCGHSPYVTSSLARGWVSRLQLVLAFASAVILRSESRGAHDHILLSQIGDSPNLEGQVPVLISPRNKVARLYPQELGSFSSLPTTRRAMVEVFDPASTRGWTSSESCHRLITHSCVKQTTAYWILCSQSTDCI